MEKKQIIEELKQPDLLPSNEKRFLINFANYKKKYGLVRESMHKYVEEQQCHSLFVLFEWVGKSIIGALDDLTTPTLNMLTPNGLSWSFRWNQRFIQHKHIPLLLQSFTADLR